MTTMHERTRMWAVRVGEHAGVTHRCYLALTLWQLGYAEEALKVNREMLELARSIDHPFSLAYALHHTSWLYQYLRQPKEALAVCGEQIRFAADQGFPLFHATGIVYEAGGSLLQGKALQALPGLIRGLDAYRATGAALALPYYLGLLGSALIDSGRPADADATLNKALSVAEESHDRCHEAELLRLKGELALYPWREPGGGGGLLPSIDRDRETTTKQGLGAARRDQPRAPLPEAEPPRRRSRQARRGLG